MADTVTAPVISAWKSDINWVSFTGPIAAIALYFGAPLTPEQIAGIVTAISTMQGLWTWISRTYFTKAIVASSTK